MKEQNVVKITRNKTSQPGKINQYVLEFKQVTEKIITTSNMQHNKQTEVKQEFLQQRWEGRKHT